MPMPWNNRRKKEIADSKAPRIPVMTITPIIPFEVIGIVTGQGTSAQTTYHALCAEAEAAGAQAVIGVQVSTAYRTPTAITMTFVGTAIRYGDPTDR